MSVRSLTAMSLLSGIGEVSRDRTAGVVSGVVGLNLRPHNIYQLFSNNSHINGGEMLPNTVTIGHSTDHLETLADGGFHCGHGDLLGPLGLLVQGILAFIAFTGLIVKRFCEPKPERRPWKIWFFDTSKQAIGAAVIHFANVFLADMFTGDPCTWYIVSFLLDSTVGLLAIYVGLRLTQYVAVKAGRDGLVLGEYGSPPQCQAWFGQCLLYILVVLVEKLLMTLLVLFDFWKKVREFIMYPIKDPQLELIIVMFIVPFIVNAFIFWVVDNFLKKKKWKAVHSPINSNESAVKYFSAVEKLKYYENTQCADESESDVLLSYDDEYIGYYHNMKVKKIPNMNWYYWRNGVPEQVIQHVVSEIDTFLDTPLRENRLHQLHRQEV